MENVDLESYGVSSIKTLQHSHMTWILLFFHSNYIKSNLQITNPIMHITLIQKDFENRLNRLKCRFKHPVP